MAGEAGEEWGVPLYRHWMEAVEGDAGSISKLCNNKKRSLVLEWSMYEVGTSPPHDLEKPHGLVASNTHT